MAMPLHLVPICDCCAANFVMNKGTQLEPVALRQYERESGAKVNESPSGPLVKGKMIS